MNLDLNINLFVLGTLCIVFYFVGAAVGYIKGCENVGNQIVTKRSKRNRAIK